MEKPLILIVNDDGIQSPGLYAAAEAVAHLGELLIAAPKEQQTSMGRARPRNAPLGIIEQTTVPINGQDHPAYAVHATPAMAVSHAVLEIAPRKPAMCISGVNYGENVAYSLLSSGTVGAAFEAASHNIPALAISIETDIHTAHTRDYPMLDYAATKHFTRTIAERLLAQGLPPHVACLNLNVPNDATPETDMRVTRISGINFYDFLEEQAQRDFSQPFKPAEHKVPDGAEPDSDVQAVVIDRVVSLTPIARNITADRAFLTDWMR